VSLAVSRLAPLADSLIRLASRIAPGTPDPPAPPASWAARPVAVAQKDRHSKPQQHVDRSGSPDLRRVPVDAAACRVAQADLDADGEAVRVFLSGPW